MKLPAPPYGYVTTKRSEEDSLGMDSSEQAAFAKVWPKWWPAYKQVLEELFPRYEVDNLLKKKRTKVVIEKLIPNRKTFYGADLLLSFSFDDSGITWDIFQKGRTIVHAQPVF
jgi:hypothetical protein